MSGKNPLGIPQTPDREWFRVEARDASADKPTSADLYIYDVIGGWFGIPAADLVQNIGGLEVDQINLYVNSPGGDVFDAVAVKNALARHPANVTAHVDGVAASAASFLITAADEVVMGENAELMIHDAISAKVGNAADMQETAKNLDRISQNIASMYAGKAGGSVDDWRSVMKAETWFTAQEAVDAGLADRIAEPDKAASANMTNRFDLSVFAHAGRGDAPAPVVPRRHSPFDVVMRGGDVGPASISFPLPRDQKRPEEPDAKNETEGVGHMADITSRIRERLGFSAEADLDEDSVLAAIDRIAAPKNTLPEGTRVIDEAQYNDLVAAAREGREARAQQIEDRRERIVAQAITDGKIPPARREHYLALMEKDEEGTTEWLNKLEASEGFSVKAKGSTGGVDAAPDDDEEAFYKKFFNTEKKGA